MSLWLVRAGRIGEFEDKFLNDKRIYLTWEGLSQDLSEFQERKSLFEFLIKQYQNEKPATVRNWTGQLWPVAKEMQIGDWVVLPSKKRPVIHIAEITGDYVNAPNNVDPFFHYRDVRWFATDIPRSNFDQDLLYSFGAFMTICRISRNDAEKRLKEMNLRDWKTSTTPRVTSDSTQVELADLEQLAEDQIAKFIIRRFKGHGMARLIEAILQAQGYTTFLSPEGPDRGIDILAAPGPLGFGSPKMCIQVKTGENPIDRPTLDQLIGTMQKVGAEQGLLVSWAGFKSSIDREIPSQFFRVRLWDQKAIIDELMRNYENLDDGIKAEFGLVYSFIGH